MNLIVTKPSHTLRQKNHRIYSQRIAETLRDRDDAKSQGDLAENAGFIEATKELENLRRTQSQLGLGDPIEIVDPHTWANHKTEENPTVRIGTAIQISRNNSRPETLIIGGGWDADLDSDHAIPYNCPLAKLLMAEAPGFKGTLHTNGQQITLLAVRNPTREELLRAYPDVEKPVTRHEPQCELQMAM